MFQPSESSDSGRSQSSVGARCRLRIGGPSASSGPDVITSSPDRRDSITTGSSDVSPLKPNARSPPVAGLAIPYDGLPAGGPAMAEGTSPDTAPVATALLPLPGFAPTATTPPAGSPPSVRWRRIANASRRTWSGRPTFT
ncbi:hypothetical protein CAUPRSCDRAFT_12195 [Caulochytrium protostelioides]|uniref:Uncharacterized protein n=1 Tax=Caulochytrium protostelioides TaxID=1555241 RepID=A0A4P9WUF8_9FUNG|nr:hypothetical protein CAUPRSCDRAFT_12195 [Caulochytrium protostelioides]